VAIYHDAVAAAASAAADDSLIWTTPAGISLLFQIQTNADGVPRPIIAQRLAAAVGASDVFTWTMPYKSAAVGALHRPGEGGLLAPGFENLFVSLSVSPSFLYTRKVATIAIVTLFCQTEMTLHYSFVTLR
jgi:hypothetical protein